MHQHITLFTLAADTVPDAYTIELTDATGLVVNQQIGMEQDGGLSDIFFAKILSISTNTLTIDRPIDKIFATGTTLFWSINPGLNVDGSTTREIFIIHNISSTPIDITRLIFSMTDTAAMDDGLFGGQPVLTRGVVLRKKFADGSFLNYWNAKTNGRLSELMFDLTYSDKAPAGVNGLSARLTFGGQNKLGVVIRLHEGDELQMLIQDDLTGLTTFKITAEGHYTDETS